MDTRIFLIVALCFSFSTALNGCSSTSQTQRLDWNAPTSVGGAALKTLQCVKDTQIDFNFPQATSGFLNVTSNNGSGTFQQLKFVRVG